MKNRTMVKFAHRIYFYFSLFLVACTFFVSQSVYGGHLKKHQLKKDLNQTINQWFTDTQVPGVIVGIWMPHFKFVMTRGVSDKATQKPMSTKDHVRIGSITKEFTVTILLQLADEGVLSLDDPVSKYYDIPNGNNITLRMLANMTSGIFNYSENPEFLHELLLHPERIWSPIELINIGISQPSLFPPGTNFSYSNTNTVLLGVIVEKVTGTPIAELFREKIYRPLRLCQTVWPGVSPLLPKPFAHGYSNDTLSGENLDVTFNNPSWASYAGELISTFKNLKKWARACATGKGLLSKQMQQQRLTFVPVIPNIASYGLGIANYNGFLGHIGSIPGYNSIAVYSLEKKITIVIVVNTDNLVLFGDLEERTEPVSALLKLLIPILDNKADVDSWEEFCKRNSVW